LLVRTAPRVSAPSAARSRCVRMEPQAPSPGPSPLYISVCVCVQAAGRHSQASRVRAPDGMLTAKEVISEVTCETPHLSVFFSTHTPPLLTYAVMHPHSITNSDQNHYGINPNPYCENPNPCAEYVNHCIHKIQPPLFMFLVWCSLACVCSERLLHVHVCACTGEDTHCHACAAMMRLFAAPPTHGIRRVLVNLPQFVSRLHSVIRSYFLARLTAQNILAEQFRQLVGRLCRHVLPAIASSLLFHSAGLLLLLCWSRWCLRINDDCSRG